MSRRENCQSVRLSPANFSPASSAEPCASSLSSIPPLCIDLTLLTMRNSGHMPNFATAALPCSWSRRSAARPRPPLAAPSPQPGPAGSRRPFLGRPGSFLRRANAYGRGKMRSFRWPRSTCSLPAILTAIPSQRNCEAEKRWMAFHFHIGCPCALAGLA